MDKALLPPKNSVSSLIRELLLQWYGVLGTLTGRRCYPCCSLNLILSRSVGNSVGTAAFYAMMLDMTIEDFMWLYVVFPVAVAAYIYISFTEGSAVALKQ